MRRSTLFFISISIALLLLVVADIAIGSVSVSFGEVLKAVFGGSSDAMTNSIINNFRIPKAIVAVMAGAALSASGLQMQTLFKNPLAGPFVLGISSGASLGVAIFLLGLPVIGLGALTEGARNLGIVGSAWIGSALILLVIMSVSSRIKDIMAILILGMMFGSAATAVVEILQFLSPEGAVKSFVVWTMGSLGGVSGAQLRILVPIILVGLLMSVLLIKSLNILLLGENYARTMGVNIAIVRGMIFLSTVLLAGTITAFCGPIGFIGIAVPHVARMIFGEADHKILMPASMLIGASLMLVCDIISQMPGSDMVLPINTITALMGIPVVVIVIVRNRKLMF